MLKIFKNKRLAAQQNKELQKKQTALRAETRLLRGLIFSSPTYHVQMLSSFRAVIPQEPFYGYWIDSPETCAYASCGSTIDKATFSKGFVLGHGGHHHMIGVWAGDTFQQLSEVCATLGIKVSNEALQHLVQSREQLYFVRPDYPEQCPVYKLNAQQVLEAHRAGCITELQPIAGEENQQRQVQTGDQLLLLPSNGNWTMPMRIFPPDWLPADRYRRV
jgi:hypothetical protein